MSTKIKIGPKQLLKPEAAMAQIGMEESLGNHPQFHPTSWKKVVAAVEVMDNPEAIKGMLPVITRLLHDARYSRGSHEARVSIATALHKILPFIHNPKDIVKILPLMDRAEVASYLTAEQCIELAKYKINTVTSYHDMSVRAQLDGLVLRSVRIFQAPEAIVEIGKRVNYDESYASFLGHVVYLMCAAEAVIPADVLPKSDVAWSAIRLLFNTCMTRGHGVSASELSSFLHQYSDRVQIEHADGQFTIKLKEKEITNENESQKES